MGFPVGKTYNLILQTLYPPFFEKLEIEFNIETYSFKKIIIKINFHNFKNDTNNLEKNFVADVITKIYIIL